MESEEHVRISSRHHSHLFPLLKVSSDGTWKTASSELLFSWACIRSHGAQGGMEPRVIPYWPQCEGSDKPGNRKLAAEGCPSSTGPQVLNQALHSLSGREAGYVPPSLPRSLNWLCNPWAAIGPPIFALVRAPVLSPQAHWLHWHRSQ